MWSVVRFAFGLTMAILSSILIGDAIVDWSNNPTSSSTRSVKHSKIPFPAVSVCLDFETKWLGVRKFLIRHDKSSDVYDLFKGETKFLALALKTFGRVQDHVQEEDNDGDSVMTGLATTAVESKMLEALFKTVGLLPFLKYFLQTKKSLDSIVDEATKLLIEQKSPEKALEILTSKYEDLTVNYTQAMSIKKYQQRRVRQFYNTMTMAFDRVSRKSLITLAIDILSNREKYGASKTFLTKIMTFIATKTRPLLGLPAPIIYDLMQVQSVKKHRFVQPKIQYGAASMNVDDWFHYDTNQLSKNLALCLQKKYNCSLAFSEVKELLEPHWSQIDEFMADSQMEIHEPAEFPVVPFCWFGEKANWLGQDQPSYGSNDIKKCDLFKPMAVPHQGHCYTLDSNLRG